MSILTDAIASMREVVLLTDKVDRAGAALEEMAGEVREHDRRLIRIETRLDTYTQIAQIGRNKD